MKSILLVTNSLSETGGAEKVLSVMANYWIEKGWDVTMASFDNDRMAPFYQLSSKINCVALNLPEVPNRPVVNTINIIRRINKLRRLIKLKNPDLVISFITGANIITLLSTFYLNVPVIVSERNDPYLSPVNPVKSLLRRWLYPKANAVVCQTQKILDYYPPEVKKKGAVIPNPVLRVGQIPESIEISLPKNRLLFAIGGMSKQKIKQKGFDILIEVFADLAKKHRDWSLVLLGDGPERSIIEQKTKELNLEQRVLLPGNVKDVHSILVQGDLFVLSSRYEGFPNALCEAMACGLPAVSFDCPTGPGEIIRDGMDGILVNPEDWKGLETALSRLMGSEPMRKEMGQKAQEVVNRFDIEKVMGLWEDLMAKVKITAD